MSLMGLYTCVGVLLSDSESLISILRVRYGELDLFRMLCVIHPSMTEAVF